MVTAVGINRTSNASFAVMRDGELEYFGRKERITREKHAWGHLGDLDSYLRHYGKALKNVDVVVECYSSDPERNQRQEYEAELTGSGLVTPRTKRFEISHHFSHALTALPLSGFEDPVVLVADNRGSPMQLVGPDPLVRDGGLGGPLEVISIFAGRSPESLERLGVQQWDPSTEVMAGLGTFFTAASELVFGREHAEGVLMGLAAYGDAGRLDLPQLQVEEFVVRPPAAWLEILREEERFSFFRRGPGMFSDCADLAAAAQATFESALLKVARHARHLSGKTKLAYAGGCALNCAANGRLMAEAGFEQVYIPPTCDDGGTAIGCAVFGLSQLNVRSYLNGASDYLGKDYQHTPAEVMTAGVARGLEARQPSNLVGELATALTRQKTVGICDGRSEGGARALGHRSILADPRFDVMRNHINRDVKNRAWFRPLAPIVPLDEVSKYFNLDEPSPFMQRKVDVRPEWRARLGAICHVDGSARVQTVSEDDNLFIYNLLKTFGAMNGCAVLLNTSFNGRDEPIVETLDDALNAFLAMPIDLLCIGRVIFSKPAFDGANPLLG